MNEATFDRVEVGMSEADVNALLGGPAGDYTTMNVLQAPVRPMGRTGTTPTGWFGNEGTIVIGFDEDRRVAWKQFINVVSLDETWLEKCKGWIGQSGSPSALVPKSVPTQPVIHGLPKVEVELP
jgi:hypothetical protein